MSHEGRQEHESYSGVCELRESDSQIPPRGHRGRRARVFNQRYFETQRTLRLCGEILLRCGSARSLHLVNEPACELFQRFQK